MYTQCPDCKTAFRVSAKILKQAAGKVRCGSCGSAFNAVQFLSEAMPKRAIDETGKPIPELVPEPKQTLADTPASLSTQRSQALLQSLNELAGSDIRIEDTGVEWQVLGEDEVPGPGSTIDELLDESPTPVDEFLTKTPTSVDAAEIFYDAESSSAATGVDELRFDDDTPLPDNFAGSDDSGDSPTSPAFADSPGESGSDNAGAGADAEKDEDGDNDEWADILFEFEQRDASKVPPLDAELAALDEAETLVDDAAESDAEADSADAAAASDHAQAGAASTVVDDTVPPDTDADDDSDDTRNQPLDEDEDEGAEPAPLEFAAISTLIAENAGQPDSVAEESGDDVAPAAGTDDDVAADDFRQKPGDAMETQRVRERLIKDADISPGFESIVMEGDFVSSAHGNDKRAADIAAAALLAEQAGTTRDEELPEQASGRSRGMTTAVVALALILIAQAVHQSRESLVTAPVIGGIMEPLYEAAGKPVYPAWDVSGWRVEATTGNADENADRLTVYSRIGNQSGKPLPYPLIGITLTDRYDAVVGGRVLAPAEYLAGDIDPRQMISPGATFNAVIPLRSPGDDAAGFKLNICYRLAPTRLRCADNGFR